MSILNSGNPGRTVNTCRPGFAYLFIAGIISLFFLTVEMTYGQGNLLITPRRVVFEGNKRSFDLNLANTGKDTAIYSISVIQIRMTEEGGFQEIETPDPGQQFADRFIRYFPRQVTLGPGESQAVKVQLIRTNELKPGEYRSHFYFRAVTKAKPLGEDATASKDTSAFSVRITPIFGITVPVIIQNGTSTMKVDLTDPALSNDKNGNPVITFTFNRSGNMSVYGNIAIDHISPQGKVTRVGIANGVAVYTPNLIRRFTMSLTVPEGVSLKSGKLRITYSSASDLKTEKYSETELILK